MQTVLGGTGGRLDWGFRDLTALQAGVFNGLLMIPDSIKKRFVAGFFLVLLTYSASVVSANAGQHPQAQVEHSSDPRTLVISYREVFPEFAGQDSTPLVRIYGDGRLLVFQPAYMKQAGRYEGYLSRSELQTLLKQFTPLMLNFNAKEIRRQKNDADYHMVTQAKSLQDVTVYYESDSTVSNFHINFESYRPSAVQGSVIVGSAVNVSWPGLGFDAEHYPGVKQIQGLRQMEKTLKELSLRPDLRKSVP